MSRVKATFKSAAVIAYFALLLPLIWEDKQQVKDDLRHLADWWLK